MTVHLRNAGARRGTEVVQVYVRGRGRSGGVKSDSLGLQVGRDGCDVVEWIAAQPWSDGHIVMFGGSFVGMTQWRTAAQHPPHLATRNEVGLRDIADHADIGLAREVLRVSRRS